MAKTPFERTGTLGINATNRNIGAPVAPPARRYGTAAPTTDIKLNLNDSVDVQESTKAPKPTRKRAHTEDGKFKADDPSTPDVNEAYVQDEEVESSE